MPRKQAANEEAAPDGAVIDSTEAIVGPHPIDRRSAAIEDITKARNDLLKADGFEVEEITEEGGQEAAPDGEQESAEQESAEQEEPDEQEEQDEQLYEVVVDGQKQKVTLAELQKNYQIEQAARTRMNEAAESLKRAHELEERARERAGKIENEGAEEPPEKESPDDPSQANWDDLAEKLQYGDKEEAAAALKKAAESLRGGAGSSPEEVEVRVMERIEWNQALAEFGEEYSDIVNDPYLSQLAGQIGNKLYTEALEASKSGQPRPPYRDIFNRAGVITRGWLKKASGQDSEGAEPNRDDNGRAEVNLSKDRSAEKRASVKPPTGRSVQSGGPAAPQKPKTDVEIRQEGIAEIIKGRQKQL